MDFVPHPSPLKRMNAYVHRTPGACMIILICRYVQKCLAIPTHDDFTLHTQPPSGQLLSKCYVWGSNICKLTHNFTGFRHCQAAAAPSDLDGLKTEVQTPWQLLESLGV